MIPKPAVTIMGTTMTVTAAVTTVQNMTVTGIELWQR